MREDGIFGQVSSNLLERFQLDFSAPCNHGKLIDCLGFMDDTSVAQVLLEGTYKLPNNIDQETRLLLE